MVKTATITIPLVWPKNETDNNVSSLNESFDKLTSRNGYKVKLMQTFVINNRAYAHYVLEKED